MIWSLVVHAAGLQDNDPRAAGEAVVRLARRAPRRLRKIWADGAYRGRVGLWAGLFGWDLERVVRPDGTRGFTVEPRRWVVERTFAWLTKCRRLRCDDEQRPDSSEALIRLAMIGLRARRLAP